MVRPTMRILCGSAATPGRARSIGSGNNHDRPHHHPVPSRGKGAGSRADAKSRCLAARDHLHARRRLRAADQPGGWHRDRAGGSQGWVGGGMNIIVLDAETFYSDDFTLSKLTTEDYVRSERFEVHGW